MIYATTNAPGIKQRKFSIMKHCAMVFLLSLVFSNVSGQSDSLTDGEVRSVASVGLEAWDLQHKEWVSIEAFWIRYTDRRGGITWGRRTDYPPYAEVKELDTMIIELESGSCLMEFFHTRWRRANDVRRWDAAFNNYAGCRYVFD